MSATPKRWGLTLHRHTPRTTLTELTWGRQGKVGENWSEASHTSTLSQCWVFLRENDANLPVPSTRWILRRSNRKHPDWCRYKLEVPNPTHYRYQPSEHQLQRRGQLTATSPKGSQRQWPPPIQPFHPAATWQTSQKYLRPETRATPSIWWWISRIVWRDNSRCYCSPVLYSGKLPSTLKWGLRMNTIKYQIQI